MTNNGTGQIGNFGNVVYDSGNDTSSGRKRIGISATEIELLSDIPPSLGTGQTTSGNNVSDRARVFDTQVSSSSIEKQKQQNNYQTLSVNRGPSKSNVVYQDGNDQQLNSAVDKLLDKYAPDATPQNFFNTSNNRGVPPQVNVVTARDEPSVFTFQTTAPPSSTAANNYSTIIRPRTEQIPQTQTQINPNNNNNNRNHQTPTRSRPVTTYDSFQHVLPPPIQQQQQQAKSQTSIPIQTKNGNFAQVIPGKVYALDEDPLHLLYDRQNIVPPPQQKPSYSTTFQPSNNFPTASVDPLTVMYTSTSQRYPPQSIPMTTDPNFNGVQPFDLGNLIKRVQQDYLREIQPFVSSVKFVEKDREYGQNLADIGFTTPVTVRKGFTRQTDDILRRSFGRENRPQPPSNRYEDNTYSEDDDDDDENIVKLRPSNHQRPLQKFDSKQSFTSVTSVSTNASDYDEHYSSSKNRKKKVEVHNQSTSPPPQVKQTKAQPQIKNPPAASLDIPSKPVIRNQIDEDEETTTIATPPIAPKLAKRIPSDQHSITSSGSDISDDQEEFSAKYNEHELPHNLPTKPTEAIHAIATTAPVAKPINEPTRERVITENQMPLHSEDIHPTPPTIRPAQPSLTVPTNSRTQAKKSVSEESNVTVSGSEDVTGSEDDDESATYNEQPQAPAIARSNIQQVAPSVPAVRGPNLQQVTPSVPAVRGPNVQQVTPSIPAARGSNEPQTNARGTTAPQNPPSTSRTTPDNNARQAAGAGTNPNTDQRSATNDRGAPTTSQNPPSASRTATDNNARQAAGANPTNQRSATNDRAGPATSTNPPASTGGAAQTGSTRFFQSENTPKSGGKRSNNNASTSIGNRIKSIFRRK